MALTKIVLRLFNVRMVSRELPYDTARTEQGENTRDFKGIYPGLVSLRMWFLYISTKYKYVGLKRVISKGVLHGFPKWQNPAAAGCIRIRHQ
jgi:hypothetical protein